MHLGRSSRTYPLDATDLAALPDCAAAERPREKDLPGDETILFIRKGRPDVLLRGREAVSRAAREGAPVDVRIVFKPTIAKWNLLFTLVRALRSGRRFSSSGTYHIATSAVRQMGLERAVRTLDAPQRRDGKDGERMARLEKSLREDGYDDSKPIKIMLCRSRGCEDSLRQGHHRISACLACGVPKMAVKFSAAGALPRFLAKLFSKPPFRADVFRTSLESRIGRPIAKLVPIEDGGGRKGYVAVPEDGGRFVVKLSASERDARRLAKFSRRLGAGAVPGEEIDTRRPVQLGGRYVFGLGYSRGKAFDSPLALSTGIAQAVLVPLLVAGALVLDIVLMKQSGGARSIVAWCQAGSAAASCALFAVLAAGERRCRGGFAFAAALFAAMALNELFRDIETGAVAALRGPVASALVLGALAIAVATPFFAKRSFPQGLRALVASRGFLALPFGAACIWGAAKIVSADFLWRNLGLEPGKAAAGAAIAEEGTELLGYAVVFCWAVMFFIERLAAWRRARR